MSKVVGELSFHTVNRFGIDLDHLSEINQENLSSFIQQRVNQKLYESLLSRSLPPLSSSSQPQPRTILSEEELNIVRYAAGYVPHKLLKKHNKSDSVKSVNFAKCLIKMAISGDETNLLQYTVTWTKLINRGNLFEISDSTFLFFQQVELLVQNKLQFALQSSTQHHINDVKVKDDIFHSVLQAENAQLYWSILSADICKQEHCDEFLREIVDTCMWIAIRGHSIAGAWLQIYKQCKHKCKTTKKQKSLRTSLKQLHNP